MWHSVKLELRDSKDILSGIKLSNGNTHIHYDFHILLTEDFDTSKERYEIDVYPVFYKDLTKEYLTNPTYESSYKGLEVDTSELLYQYHVSYDPKVFPEKAEENGLKEYRVQIVLSEGSVVYVKAKDEEEAYEKESRYRMQNLYNVESFYSRLTGEYNLNFFEALIIKS